MKTLMINLLPEIIIVAILILILVIKKNQNHKKVLKSLKNKLGFLRTRCSYNQVTVVTLYDNALEIVSKIIGDTYLTKKERYDILHELEELMSIHLFYRIRTMKNSREFMESFESLWKEGVEIPVPSKSRMYLQIKKITGIKGETISLFWNSELHFAYSILDARNYILKTMEKEVKLVKLGILQENNNDFLNLAGRLEQLTIAHLNQHPNSAIASENKFFLERINKITKEKYYTR